MASEIELLVPEELRGFEVMKSRDGEWYLGRPKGSAIWWDKCSLGDLLNLGLSRDDLEGVVPDQVCRVKVALVFPHPQQVVWRHVLSPVEGICQIGFSDTDGQVIRLNISIECAQNLLSALTDALDASRKYCGESRAPLNQLQTME